MTVAFVRQLGTQPGIQLNPLKDGSDSFAPDNADQVFGIAMRAKRGRIDRCFKVNRGNLDRKLGTGESLRANALNEARVQVFESLSNGSFEAVVHRLTPSAALLSYIVAAISPSPVRTASTISAASSDKSFNDSANGFITAGFAVGQTITTTGFAAGGNNGSFIITAVTDGKITIGGADGAAIVTAAAGVAVTITATAGSGVGDIVYSVAAAIPGSYVFALRHLECFNDGVIVEVHADSTSVAGVPVNAKVINLRVREPNGNLIFDFVGSLDVTAIDDFGKSFFIGDVIEASQSVPDLEITVAAGQTINASSNAYGRDANGADKLAKSTTLIYFSEGGTGYVSADYITARQRLAASEFGFGYIASGGSQAAGLLSQLAQLSFDTNRQLRLDVPGSLSPSAAITFVEQLNLDTHYVAAFWAPLRADDPVNGGKAVIGTGGFHIGQACLRNADTNAQGFAPKNRAVAGKAYPLNRTGVRQIYDPTQFELSDLAKAKINPVLFERYNGGGAYVFTDSLTLARTEASFRKLITVADMSSSIDDVVTKFGKEVLLLPMQTAVARMKTFLQRLFEGAEAAGWLVPSKELDGASFTFTVAPNQLRPADRMDVAYTLRYDGTVRQIFAQQTITR